MNGTEADGSTHPLLPLGHTLAALRSVGIAVAATSRTDPYERFPHTAPTLHEWHRSRRLDAPPPAPGTYVGRTVSVACGTVGRSPGLRPSLQALRSRLPFLV